MTTHAHRRTSLTRRRGAVLGATVAGALTLTGVATSVSASAAQGDHRPPAGMTRVVSAAMPVSGHSRQLAAVRPTSLATKSGHVTPPGKALDNWKSLYSMNGSVIHDVDFPSRKVGFAAGELGQVWKTTDGGRQWSEVLNRGFPIYYYGVEALTTNDVVVSGFNDQTSQGILTWSHDGGQTWGTDEVISPNAWVDRVRIPESPDHGLAMNGLGSPGSAPNDAWYTSAADQWNQVTVDPSGGWFGNQFTFTPDGSAYASGITYCNSGDYGQTWGCRGSIDSVFDGATEFVNSQDGWVGGGEISPNVEGWVHRTTDGGATWSDRVLDTPWPVRQLQFLSPSFGWATGGNVYSGVGGMYVTTDGGQTWTQDDNTGTEVGSCADHSIVKKRTKVWCVGFTFNGSNFVSTVYMTKVKTPKH